jgi:hypothetical protein
VIILIRSESLHAQHTWTIPSRSCTHRNALFKGEPEDCSKALERAGYWSPKLDGKYVDLYGRSTGNLKKVRGYTIADTPLFFDSVDRVETTLPTGLDEVREGSPQSQRLDDSSIFWDENQGPVVMVWNDMIPIGESEEGHTGQK